MKVLVLGSEGFIGGHTVEYFQSLGHHVTKADIQLKEEPDYLLINPESQDFGALFSHAKYDVCINATGVANVQLSFSSPALDFSLNTANVYYILDGIRIHCPECKFINISSAAVYGNPSRLPIDESAAIRPVSPYGRHKAYSEQVCREFFELFNIPTISVRVFSAYGEGLRKQLFWDLYKKAAGNRGTITMFGSGSETRDFIYIKDLVHALNCVIGKGEFNGGVINVASGVETPVREAVDLFMEAFPHKAGISYLGSNKIGDPLNWRADISRLHALGFEAQYSLRQGIHNFVKWAIEKG